MRIVIGGSYHKFLNDINELHDKLEKSGHIVLAPIKDAIKSKVDEKYSYVLFQGEEEENPIDVQERFMERYIMLMLLWYVIKMVIWDKQLV